MADIPAPHRFNSDLLDDRRDQETARRAYPKVFDLLYDKELLDLFHRYDRPANRAKRRSRWRGLAAVGLAVVALGGTAAEPLYPSLRGLAVLFAALGLVAIGLGFGGVLVTTAKMRWLHNRLVGERLRQFHFQTLVCRVDEIAAFAAGQKEQFIADRQGWLAQFRIRFADPQVEAEFSAILRYEDDPLWLHPAPRPGTSAADKLPADFAGQLFAAYRDLRIRHQLQYADYNLGHGGLSLARQRSLLTGLALGATLLLFLVEFVMVAAGLYAGLTKFVAMTAIWCAVVALATRTLDEGLQPRREFERYHRYRLAVRDILDRFEAAGSSAEKFALMAEMEWVSYEEMRDFLRSSNEARFIM